MPQSPSAPSPCFYHPRGRVDIHPGSGVDIHPHPTHVHWPHGVEGQSKGPGTGCHDTKSYVQSENLNLFSKMQQ